MAPKELTVSVPASCCNNNVASLQPVSAHAKPTSSTPPMELTMPLLYAQLVTARISVPDPCPPWIATMTPMDRLSRAAPFATGGRGLNQ